eukprot:gene1632-12757_t
MSEKSTNKKRKIEKVELSNDDETKRLKNVFQNTDALLLIEKLQSLTDNKKTAKMLSELFPLKEFPSLNLSAHCYRCHENYDPDHNTNERCILGHTGEIMTEQTDEGMQNGTDEML